MDQFQWDQDTGASGPGVALDLRIIAKADGTYEVRDLRHEQRQTFEDRDEVTEFLVSCIGQGTQQASR